eukprot:COSAG01_NODE_1855_length_9052_cov_4.358883_3_plen_107_part_00
MVLAQQARQPAHTPRVLVPVQELQPPPDLVLWQQGHTYLGRLGCRPAVLFLLLLPLLLLLLLLSAPFPLIRPGPAVLILGVPPLRSRVPVAGEAAAAVVGGPPGRG